jgi:hypothetical protein
MNKPLRLSVAIKWNEISLWLYCKRGCLWEGKLNLDQFFTCFNGGSFKWENNFCNTFIDFVGILQWKRALLKWMNGNCEVGIKRSIEKINWKLGRLLKKIKNVGVLWGLDNTWKMRKNAGFDMKRFPYKWLNNTRESYPKIILSPGP